MFAAIGGLGLALGADYASGSLTAVGPGFLPRLLSWGLVVLGFAIAATSFRLKPEATFACVASGFSRLFRPLACVTLGITAFALLIDPFGLLVAGAALLVIGAGASDEFRWRETALLAAVLLVFSWLLFVWGLGLPIPTWPAPSGVEGPR